MRLPDEYDFLDFLRGLSAAQTRAEEKAGEAAAREPVDGSTPAVEGRSLLREIWGPDKEPVWPHEDRSQLEGIEGSGGEQDAGTYDLRALLEMLGEE